MTSIDEGISGNEKAAGALVKNEEESSFSRT